MLSLSIFAGGQWKDGLVVANSEAFAKGYRFEAFGKWEPDS